MPDANVNKSVEKKKDANQATASSNTQGESLIARLIGIGLIILAVIFIILTFVVILLSRREAKVDDSIRVPSVEAPEYVNTETFTVNGETDGKATVIIYVDGEEVSDGVNANKEGEFEYVVTVDGEGEYEIQAATVKGFPLKKRSELSEAVMVVVDKTAPAADVTTLKSEKSGEFYKVVGKTEAGAKVTLKNNEDEFTAVADENGDFVIPNVKIENGKDFNVIVEDVAGNRVLLEDKFVVEEVKTPTTDGTGTGTTGGNTGTTGTGTNNGKALPEASGELSAALDLVRGQGLMVLFAISALSLFVVNMGVVTIKSRK